MKGMSFVPNMYFAKVNVNSDVYDIYEKPSLLEKILDKVIISVNTDNRFSIPEELDSKNIGDEIKFITLDKDVTKRYISGRLIRIYEDDLEKYDSKNDDIMKLETGELARYSTFYFDLNTEIIGFTLGKYFGKAQFCCYFEFLLNNFIEEVDFKVILLKNEDELKNSLMRFKRISRIHFSIIPPNPNEAALKKMFGASAQDLKESNVHLYNQEFKAGRKGKGLNEKAKYFNDVIEGVAMGYGKMVVEGQDDSGEDITVYSEKNHPETRPIRSNEKNSISGVIEIAKKWIGVLAVKYRG